MRFSAGHRIVFVAAFGALLLACPNRRKIASPEPPVPRDGNQEALRQFEESQAQFRRGEGDDVPAERFEAIVKEFPDDPIVPHALLYAGMSSVRTGEYKQAIENLDQLAANAQADEALIERGLLYRGLAKNYSGDFEGAIRDLNSGKDTIGNAVGEREEWYAAMANAHSKTGRVAAALPFYDGWYSSARESEKAYIVARVEKVVELIEPESLESAYNALETQSGPGAAFAGRRLAAQLRTAGDADRAESIEEDTEDARRSFGLTVAVGGDADAGDPNRVGGVLPLSGRQSRIGEYSGRGLALAASFGDKSGEGASGGWPRRFALVLRDSSSTATKAAEDLKELLAQDVIAVVGPVRRDSARAASAAAAAASLPIVTLNGRPEDTDSPYVFHVVHSPEMRAQALARHAFSKGMRDFAILRPRVKYGQAVGGAFRAEVERLGGTVIVEVGYPGDTTSFKDFTAKLKKPWQAIFIPDSAKKLELIAPALAIANLNSRPKGEKGPGRSIMLLSTAEALTPDFVAAAARYSWGAIFAPGFYADERDTTIGPFVDRYRRTFGTPPTATDAYAFDAALAIRSVVEVGAKNRGELAAGLATVKVSGLTGAIGFDPATHRRKDPGVLFHVAKIAAGGYTIRALR